MNIQLPVIHLLVMRLGMLALVLGGLVVGQIILSCTPSAPGSPAPADVTITVTDAGPVVLVDAGNPCAAAQTITDARLIWAEGGSLAVPCPK
jgi:hypothetical protein